MSALEQEHLRVILLDKCNRRRRNRQPPGQAAQLRNPSGWVLSAKPGGRELFPYCAEI